ncbi:MAG: hemerythrin domain-containing protein [Gammaproteobacteria bacterium]
MNVIEQLRNDHDELKDVMATLELSVNEQKDNDKTEECFQQFKKLYQIHTQVEEDIVYPAFEKYSELKKLSLKGYQAHHMVDVGLLELKLLPYFSESWGPKFSVIRDSILTHMGEEEQELFAQAEMQINTEELMRLGDEMNDLKQRKR